MENEPKLTIDGQIWTPTLNIRWKLKTHPTDLMDL